MKLMLMRLRWVLVAVLVLTLYFEDRGNFTLVRNTLWLFAAVFIFASLSKQLNRIERKVDASSNNEIAAI
ncbi:MAG TPA: hypothetical protein VNY29_16015 [Terriglobales bacterium]|nr:hypothetical protein [Terriglobales bacterium]